MCHGLYGITHHLLVRDSTLYHVFDYDAQAFLLEEFIEEEAEELIEFVEKEIDIYRDVRPLLSSRQSRCEVGASPSTFPQPSNTVRIAKRMRNTICRGLQN